jgi:hypothetical protein
LLALWLIECLSLPSEEGAAPVHSAPATGARGPSAVRLKLGPERFNAISTLPAYRDVNATDIAMDPNLPTAQALHFELHVSLTPKPEGLRPVWRAELRGSTPADSLQFASMPELIRYLARLDTGALPHGIR